MKYLQSFFWGIIAALGALLLEFIFLFLYQLLSFSGKEIAGVMLITTIPVIAFASFFEEISKMLIIGKKIKNILTGHEVIVSSLFLGVGFSFIEIASIISQTGSSQWQSLLQIAILHTGTAGIIGYLLLGTGNKYFLFSKTLIMAWLIHFFYNFIVLKSDGGAGYVSYGYIAILIIVNIVNIIRTRKNLRPAKI
jgi:hypothetical protein